MELAPSLMAVTAAVVYDPAIPLSSCISAQYIYKRVSVFESVRHSALFELSHFHVCKKTPFEATDVSRKSIANFKFLISNKNSELHRFWYQCNQIPPEIALGYWQQPST